MERMIEQLGSYVKRSVVADLSSSAGAEFRGAFTGLPRELLRELWREVARDGGMRVGDDIVPILLVDEAPQPAVGRSCVCTWPEVISYRGALARFVVLHHHDDQVAESISSTVTTFGQGEIVTLGQGGIDRWKTQNPLVSQVLAGLPQVGGVDGDQQEQLERLLAAAMEQAAEGENLDKEEANNRQWALLSGFVALADAPGAHRNTLVASLGFPRMASGALNERQQVDALRRLADHLQGSGIGPGIEELIEQNPDLAEALRDLCTHLRRACDGPQFRSSPSTYFRPALENGTPPSWWWQLTVEAILDLLAERATPDGLRVRVDPELVILGPGRGVASYVLCGDPSGGLRKSRPKSLGVTSVSRPVLLTRRERWVITMDEQASSWCPASLGAAHA